MTTRRGFLHRSLAAVAGLAAGGALVSKREPARAALVPGETWADLNQVVPLAELRATQAALERLSTPAYIVTVPSTATAGGEFTWMAADFNADEPLVLPADCDLRRLDAPSALSGDGAPDDVLVWEQLDSYRGLIGTVREGRNVHIDVDAHGTTYHGVEWLKERDA